MKIYAVQYNGKVSQEAYPSLAAAQDFIIRRTGMVTTEPRWTPYSWFEAETKAGDKYTIVELTVRTGGK